MNIAKYKIHYHKTKNIHLEELDNDSKENEENEENTKNHYHKTKNIHLEELDNDSKENEENTKIHYSPFKIDKLQQYNPIYSLFFELNDHNFNNISLNHKYNMKNLKEVINIETQEITKKNVFIKFSPLLDPIRYMIGKYDIEDIRIRTLPTINSTEKDCLSKYLEYTNASYTDNFFCFLSSILLNTHRMLHGVDYFGSYLGIQQNFRMNIEDDLEYLSNSSFFTTNVGKLFLVENYENRNDFSLFHGSRGNKEKIVIINSADSDIELNDINYISIEEETEVISQDSLPTDCEVVYLNEKNSTTKKSSNNSSIDSSNDSKSNYSSDEENDDENNKNDQEEDDENDNDSKESWEDEDEEDDEENDGSEPENDTIAYIHNFPVQLICIEKCDGTFDELFENENIDEKTGASALFQIIMTLLIFQKAFNFTHNDLHTNNIMYVETKQEFLYYLYNGIYYKVPTYGKIYKIIDFGRAIYKFQGKQFCGDSFASGGDAATQYNFEPFFNKNKPRLDPNYSFDLCRLGCSIYDFVIDDDEEMNGLDEFQKTISRWCTDDSGKNILYKKNGEERYPNFKLYKMIARTVHKHEPAEQLKYPFFKQFEMNNVNKKKKKKINQDYLINIDEIPIYV